MNNENESYKQKILPKFGRIFCLAEDEGFEPPQTESESGVLPLHKSSRERYHYMQSLGKVKGIFTVSPVGKEKRKLMNTEIVDY